MNTTTEYVISLSRLQPIPVVTEKKRGGLPVRMSPLLTSPPSVSAKRAHGSCINQQHGDPRLSPDAPPPVIWLPEPCHYAGALSQSPLSKYETPPLCVTNFYIQQRSREKKCEGTFFPPICELETLKRWEGLMGRGTEESEDVSHYSCAYHTCMTPVAISNVYTYLCVPHARPQDVTLIYKI